MADYLVVVDICTRACIQPPAPDGHPPRTRPVRVRAGRVGHFMVRGVSGRVAEGCISSTFLGSIPRKVKETRTF